MASAAAGFAVQQHATAAQRWAAAGPAHQSRCRCLCFSVCSVVWGAAEQPTQRHVRHFVCARHVTCASRCVHLTWDTTVECTFCVGTEYTHDTHLGSFAWVFPLQALAVDDLELAARLARGCYELYAVRVALHHGCSIQCVTWVICPRADQRNRCAVTWSAGFCPPVMPSA